ncbi:MAG: TIR domain-containing protein [Colwellia sp.]
MAKRVFFSFHYKDVSEFRANVVRNHWKMQPNREISGYYDASIWESAQKQGKVALKRLINSGLDQTSNTCVLIGSQTYERPWVRYELLKSFKKGSHIFGVHINSIKCKNQQTKIKGPNPLEYVGVTFSDSGLTATLWEKINGKWVKYEEIDGSASYRVEVAKKYRGNGYNLSNFYSTYDWVSNDGYNNFSGWAG